MRSTLLFGPALAILLAACAAEEPPPAPPPPPPPALPPSPAAPPAHAATPPVPPGVELSSLDPSVSPCDDFFQYACGGWNAAHPIPEDQGRWGRFQELIEKNELALKEILEKDAAAGVRGTGAPFSAALGSFYASCMDESAIEKDGIAALAPYLREIAGVSDVKGLARVTADLQSLGVDAFFDLDSEQDVKDPGQMIAGLDQAGLGMPDRDYYLKDDDANIVALRGKYVAHLSKVFVLLGDKQGEADREAAAVLSLETEMARAQISRVDHRDPQKTYHKMDRDGVAHEAPGFAWDVYWREVGLPKVAAINLSVPSYFAATFDATFPHPPSAPAADGAEAPKRPVVALARYRSYLRSHLVSAFAMSLPQRFVDEDFAFEHEKTGAPKLLPRWKRCVHAADHAMGEALAIPFVADKLGEGGKETTQAMVQSIEAAMKADLSTLPWMQGTTRDRALEKVQKLWNKIGYPDHWRAYDALVAKIRRTSFAANVIAANRFEVKRRLTEVGKPTDRTEWHMTPPTVNAYYNPVMNEMVFPAGILQPPFFTKGAPASINFGALGMVMGHELTHGFDDHGREFDGDGNLRDWWTPDVSAEFDKRAACVADQFEAYTPLAGAPEVHLNGKLTLGENLADLGGAKLALAVAHKTAPPSPESDRQFFFGVAQIWCGTLRPEMQRVRVRTDPHSPGKFRVNGPLSNMREFAQAFSCRPGDAMVREDAKRCEVW